MKCGDCPVARYADKDFPDRLFCCAIYQDLVDPEEECRFAGNAGFDPWEALTDKRAALRDKEIAEAALSWLEPTLEWEDWVTYSILRHEGPCWAAVDLEDGSGSEIILEWEKPRLAYAIAEFAWEEAHENEQ